MKYILIVASFFFILNIQGQTYYVSASGNDANAGTSTGAAWQTLAKVNATSFASGAVVRFNRGDMFYGSLIPRVGNITFDAYGIGAKPIISGFTTVTSWQSSGNGIYSAIVSNIDTTTFNLLSINGQPYAKGRYPDITTANQGYLSFVAGDTTKLWGVITGTNRVGDEIIFKPNFWTLARGRIWKQVLDTVWYRRIFDIGNGASVGYSVPNARYGYFFQDDSAYCNQFGDWHLDKVTKRLRVYFGTNPASYSVRVSTVDTLVNISNKPNVTFNNISFEGGNLYGFYSASNSGVTINTCDINQFGVSAIGFNIVSNVTIDSSTIKNTLGTAIYIKSNAVNNVNITYNTLDSMGLIPGMGSYNQGSDYSAMSVSSSSGLYIRYNRFSNAGLDVRWQGSNVDINGNYTEKFCQILADHAAGFYTYDANGATVYTNRTIQNNFVTSGNNRVGNVFGTSDSTREEVAGIYLDGTTNNVNVINNIIWRVKGNGIQLNGPSNVTVKSNIILLDSTLSTGYAGYKSNAINYNNNTGAGSIPVGGGDTISNLNIKANIAYIFKNTQRINYSVNRLTTGVSLANSMRSFGTLDSNYYNKTTTAIHGINYYNPTYNLTAYTMANWRILTLFDTHTTSLRDVIQDSVLLLTNWSNRDSTFTFTGKKYIDAYGNVYSNSTLLSPYTGRLLFYNGVSAAPLTVSVSKTNVSCNAGSNGTATATPSGGLAPYTYSWSPSGLTTSTITGRTANTYSVTVTDANGTIANGSASITQPTVLVASSVAGGIINTIGGTTSVIVTATGGTPPYTGTGTFTGMTVGSHTFNVNDANGCATTTTIVLNYTPSGNLAVYLTGTDALCYAGTGSVNSTPSGGVLPYTYSWNSGQITQNLSGISNGTYILTVTDGVSTTAKDTITILQPTELVGSATYGTITTTGGTTTVIVTAVGGTPSYTGTGTFTNVGVGTHNYPISDANGCVDTITITIPLTPIGIGISFTTSNTSCFLGTDGTANSTVTGGVPPFTYLWSNGATTQNINSLAANSYTLTVTDSVGTSATNSATIASPTPVNVIAVPGIIIQQTGTTSVVVTASGGTAPYTGTGTFTGVGIGNHTYTVTDANGCTGSVTINISLSVLHALRGKKYVNFN